MRRRAAARQTLRNAGRGRTEPVELRLLRRMEYGRSAFSSSESPLRMEGLYVFKTEDGQTIGTYEPAKWGGDLSDLAPKVTVGNDRVESLAAPVALRLEWLLDDESVARRR